jgi:hypothetical protein
MWKAEPWRDTHKSCIEQSQANLEHVRKYHQLTNDTDKAIKAAEGRITTLRALYRFIIIALSLLSSKYAFANNGFGGLTATGLKFSRTDAVEIVEENLLINLDRIEVSYIFRNTTSKEVTGEMIFPLPPLSLGKLGDYTPLLSRVGRDNLVDFTAKVDGLPQEVMIDRIAVIEPEWSDESRPSQAYDSPGRDITAELKKMGLPVSLDQQAVRAAMLPLHKADFDALQAEGAIDSVGTPLWSVVLRYHWKQAFPPGASVHVVESYENYPAGGEFIWVHSLRSSKDDLRFPEQEKQAEFFCITSDDAENIYNALKAVGEYDYGPNSKIVEGGALYSAYVLRTANSWAKPIGKFTLRLDKEDPRNLIFTCAGALKRVGQTSYVLEKEQYAPQGDLYVLVVLPAESWYNREERKSAR